MGFEPTPGEPDCDLNAAPYPLGHPDAYDSSTNFVHVVVYICMALNKTKNGLVRDLNPVSRFERVCGLRV